MTARELSEQYNISLTRAYQLINEGQVEDWLSGKIKRHISHDLEGQTINGLRVIGPAPSRNGYRCWIVEADNGNQGVARGIDLVNGKFIGKFIKNETVPSSSLGNVYKKHFTDEFGSFAEFAEWAATVGYRKGAFICRKDFTKPHSRENSFFRARRGKRIVTVNGQARSHQEWAELLGITRERVRQLDNQGILEDYIRRKL